MADRTPFQAYEATLNLQDMVRDGVAQARRAVEVHGEPDQDYAATDLICNLLHYMREVYGVAAGQAIDAALRHHNEEAPDVATRLITATPKGRDIMLAALRYFADKLKDGAPDLDGYLEIATNAGLRAAPSAADVHAIGDALAEA